MSVMVQVRNVPEAVHRKLKARAALAGVSLSDFVLGELRRSTELPTREEIRLRLQSRSRVDARPRPAAAVRRERNGR